MPSYEVCQHCSQSVRAGEAVSRDGYSYHKHCRKCYVCSETDLHGAETFRGVIFCASCAQRIFTASVGAPSDRGYMRPEPKVKAINKRSDVFFITARGCSTAREAKKPRDQHRRRTPEHGIIERARATHSLSSSLDTSKTETAVPTEPPTEIQDCYCVSDVVTRARRLINFTYFQTRLEKSVTSDIAHRSEECQRMLKDLKCPILEPHPQETTPQQLQQEHQKQLTGSLRNSLPMKVNSSEAGTSYSHSRFRSKRKDKKRKKMKRESSNCSDLRIAELGASVEIATMALRKGSSKKVISELKIAEKNEEPETVSMFSHLDSVITHTSDEEYVDSECQDYRGTKEYNGCIWDNVFKSFIKIPCNFFKKNVLQRSSLISVIVGINEETDCKAAFKRLKKLFHQDVALEHQQSGYKKLYSTINKNKTPYKLGWLEINVPGDRKTYPCKHFHQCHSYRCMRRHVMRLAGPTTSEMDGFRTRLKKYITPPYLKNLSFKYKTPAIVKPERSLKSFRRVSTRDSLQSKPRKCLEERTSQLNISVNQSKS